MKLLRHSNRWWSQDLWKLHVASVGLLWMWVTCLWSLSILEDSLLWKPYKVKAREPLWKPWTCVAELKHLMHCKSLLYRICAWSKWTNSVSIKSLFWGFKTWVIYWSEVIVNHNEIPLEFQLQTFFHNMSIFCESN